MTAIDRHARRMMLTSRWRRVAKTAAWRLLSVVVLTGLAWIVTGSGRTGLVLGVLYNLVQLCTYYLHERLWESVRWGLVVRPGSVVWFTGLPSSGKSTVAALVAERLRAPHRVVTVLDGDMLRRGLCADLGFSREDRAENLRRVREAAKLLANTGALVLAACITPYDADRKAIRTALPGCLMVWTEASPAICEQRDVKGMWAKARAGQLADFTGVQGAYEPPTADLVLHTGVETPDVSASMVVRELRLRGWT